MKFGMGGGKGTTAELDCILCTRDQLPDRFQTPDSETPDTETPTQDPNPPKKRVAKVPKGVPKGVFCRVLGVVEVKRSADDVGEAFVGYQAALNWLSGREEHYDPAEWVTKAYPTGHFRDRPFLHVTHTPPPHTGATPNPNFDRGGGGNGGSGEGGSSGGSTHAGLSLIFTPESFAGLRRTVVVGVDGVEGMREEVCGEDVEGVQGASDPPTTPAPLFLHNLYFVSRDGCLDLISSKQASWAMNKLSIEPDFDDSLSDTGAVERLRVRMQARAPHRLCTLGLVDIWRRAGVLEQLYLVGKAD
ncbi:hypothetical protein B484DRAFT_406379 [Ochromonadaceae sp. CCMP2298]|nr:hypothetical protein B484DRAFT_406379 [Ochromonadaceae sp. CCMP2298]